MTEPEAQEEEEGWGYVYVDYLFKIARFISETTSL